MTVQMTRDGAVPRTVQKRRNTSVPLVPPKPKLFFTANVARDLAINVAVKNNFGFGGTNGTLVFRRF